MRRLEAVLATEGRLPVNLKLVFEGEEESSSVHLDAWLAANRERLAADAALVADSGFFEGNLPDHELSAAEIENAISQIDVPAIMP